MSQTHLYFTLMDICLPDKPPLTSFRQPKPYTSNCLSAWPAGKSHTIPYQSQLCQSFCLDDIIIAKCGCAVPYLIEYDRY